MILGIDEKENRENVLAMKKRRKEEKEKRKRKRDEEKQKEEAEKWVLSERGLA
jgi:hypothetical protein